jgi:hypothetical protein
MEPTDITIEILKDIRTQLGQMNERIEGTNDRLDALHRRVVESEIRMATAMTDLAGTVRDMAGTIRASNELGPRVENCERELLDLKRRLP